MFVTNWISTTKIQKISEITNFFRHYFLSRTEVCFAWSFNASALSGRVEQNLRNLSNEPTLKSKVCLKCLYFTKIISALCCYLEYFSYLYTIN